MARARILRNVAELQALVPAWRRLLSQAVHPEPVLTPLWLLTWWREFGDSGGRALRVIAVEDSADLVGLVPLSWRPAAHRRAIPVRRLELLATGEDELDEIGSDYVGALVARGWEDEVSRAAAAAMLEGAAGEWDELRMPSMNGEDVFVPRFAEALRAKGAWVSVEASGECPFVPLPATWDAYLTALGSSRRYLVNRSLRALDEWAGDENWVLQRATTAAELTAGYRVLRALHAARWAGRGRSGVFASARFTRFHDEVMPRLLAGEDGASVDLFWLVVRGEPLAAAYNLVFDGKVYFYQSGRRLDVPKRVRPGIAMHALAIRRSIEAGRREYDFLAGASRYKRDLALAARPLVALRAVAPGLRPRAVEAASQLAERLIAQIRRARRPDSDPELTVEPAVD